MNAERESRRDEDRRDEGGFTLVELLVVIVIEALIVGGLGSAFILVMNNSASVKDTLSRSEDARIAAAYIVSDARNSSGPETSLSDTASCPDPSPPVAGTAHPVVRFNWDSTSSVGATSANVVNYVLVSNSLLRRQCRNGTLVGDTVVASNITGVAVACAPTANCTGTPTTITATVTETQDSNGGAAFQYSLTGAFRKVLSAGMPLLSISGPASLPAWTINRPYPSTSITGSGGRGTYSWSASGLPTGMTINAGTGAISGTPIAAGASTATITLNDAYGDPAATRQYTVTINVAPTITTTSPLTDGGVGNAYSTTITGAGGTTAYTWSATGLPAGLTINATTGEISGTPTSAGVSTVAVTLTDAAGATVTKNLSLTVATSGPMITSVVLANGGSTAGRLETDDTISVTFGSPMSTNSFCSAWSGNGVDQSLVASNDVQVNISNGTAGGDDVLTVTSGRCTFHLGSIDLGSGGYVSSAASFSGNGTNKSTITWTASTRTLTITLGTLQSGTVATVASSAPIYTASASIVDTSNNAITNSPYFLDTAQQF